MKTPSAPSRTEAIKDSLLGLCAKLGPGAKLPAVRALSASLEASTSTLDRVMAELEREGRILRKHGSGVYVAEKPKANCVALVSGVDPFAVGQSPFYQIMGKLFRDGIGFSGRGFKFYLDPHFENHGMPSREEFMADLKAGSLLGAIFMATAHPEIFLLMNELAFSYVALSDCPDALRRFHVDSPSLVGLGVDALVRAGRKSICLLTWDGFGAQMEDCHARFKASLARNGLPLLDGAIWTRAVKRPGEDAEPRAIFGAVAARELFSEPGRFDALLCTDDMLCSGALSFLRETRNAALDGVLIATHANKGSPVLSGSGRETILLQVDTEALASSALSALGSLLSGRPSEPFCENAKVEIRLCAAN